MNIACISMYVLCLQDESLIEFNLGQLKEKETGY